MKKLFFLLGMIMAVSSAYAGDQSVELNQCQRKALMAVQMKANKTYDTYVVLKKIVRKSTPNVLDEATYMVDVDLGTPATNRFVRYQALVLIDHQGSCAGNDLAQASFVKDL